MSEQDRLTPPERELEQALRSLRPAAARFDLAAHVAAMHEARRQRLHVWRLAAAAAVAGVALGIALATSGPRRSGEVGTMQPDGVAAASEPIEPPTELAYRRALLRSAGEFDALLDQHAAFSGNHDGDEARIGVVMFWRSNLESSGTL
jgi:hypothetical protein